MTEKLIDPRQSVVFQLSVPNAMLLDGFRFHARIYVMVPSYQPMRVLLFDEALVFTARLRESEHPGDRVKIFFLFLENEIQNLKCLFVCVCVFFFRYF